MNKKINLKRVGLILNQVRRLAIAYYKETGKPLGVTGEIAEYEAARLLNLRLAPAREPGFDAIRKNKSKWKKIQIKGRRIADLRKSGQRVPRINLDKNWDSVMLILLDKYYKPKAIYEAGRRPIEIALKMPGSKARNERGALSVSKFIALSKLVWSIKDKDV